MEISILAIDLGKKTGYCFKDSKGEMWGSFELDEEIPHADFHKQLINLLETYHPSAIVYGKPNIFGGAYNSWMVLNRHLKYAGIACLIAEKKDLYVFEINDTTARKKVFGSGKLKKAECQKLTGIEDPDASDATVIARAQYAILKEENAAD